MTNEQETKTVIPAQTDGLPPGYGDLLDDLKAIVRSARVRAQRAVNTELVQMYWEIGRTILERQEREGWGAKVVSRLATDLRTAFPSQRGFSRSNLMYMQQMARKWPDPIVQQPVGQLPWGHITILMSQVKDPVHLDFYAGRAVQEGWSRKRLSQCVAQELHLSQGSSPTNFAATLGEDADTVQDITKDPYRLDFVGLDQESTERDLEDALVANIVRFLTELGVGFAFVGRQYPVVVGGDEFRLDLLFYHLRLRRYVVVELKTEKPNPAHVGQLSFYTHVINTMVRDPELDGETIGILIGKDHNKAAVQTALDCQRSPLAVSSYEGSLTPEQQALMPSEEDLARVTQEVFDEER